MAIKIDEQTVIGDNRVLRINSGSTLPSSPVAVGTIFFDSSDGVLKCWNGSNWIEPPRSSQPSLFSWGHNNKVQLGTGNIISRSSPTLVVGGFTDWVHVAAGAEHTIALRANGTAWGWGNNSGQLGIGNTINRSSPASVIGGITDWVQVAAGVDHTVALRANGTAWGWGFQFNGQLGIGNTQSRNSPVPIIGEITDWVQIDAGDFHTVAIRANGTAWAWGRGSSGQLGTNDTDNRSSPTLVAGEYTDWVQVAGGFTHTVAIRANGTAWAWGNGNFGHLGTGDRNDRSSPALVAGGFTDWVQVSGANFVTVGLRANGTVWAWGSGNFGRLGTGDTNFRSSPTLVAGGFTDWVQVAAGRDRAVALRANGTAWAWGRGDLGQLGTGNTDNRSSPVSVIGGISDWVQVAAGESHTVAIRMPSN